MALGLQQLLEGRVLALREAQALGCNLARLGLVNPPSSRQDLAPRWVVVAVVGLGKEGGHLLGLVEGEDLVRGWVACLVEVLSDRLHLPLQVLASGGSRSSSSSHSVVVHGRRDKSW